MGSEDRAPAPPRRADFSIKTTFAPCSAARAAAADPDVPPPTTTTSASYEAARSDFAKGITTMIIVSTGDLGTLTSTCDFEVGTAFLPGNPDYGVVTGGANVCVLAGHDDKIQGIAEFLKYLTSPEVAGQWSVSTGYVPTSEAAANSEVYQKFLEEQPAGATALAQMEYVMEER